MSSIQQKGYVRRSANDLPLISILVHLTSTEQPVWSLLHVSDAAVGNDAEPPMDDLHIHNHEYLEYRESSPYENFITANFITEVFQKNP